MQRCTQLLASRAVGAVAHGGALFTATGGALARRRFASALAGPSPSSAAPLLWALPVVPALVLCGAVAVDAEADEEEAAAPLVVTTKKAAAAPPAQQPAKETPAKEKPAETETAPAPAPVPKPAPFVAPSATPATTTDAKQQEASKLAAAAAAARKPAPVDPEKVCSGDFAAALAGMVRMRGTYMCLRVLVLSCLLAAAVLIVVVVVVVAAATSRCPQTTTTTIRSIAVAVLEQPRHLRHGHRGHEDGAHRGGAAAVRQRRRCSHNPFRDPKTV